MRVTIIIGLNAFVVAETINDAYGKTIVIPFNAKYTTTLFGDALRITVDSDGLLITCATAFSVSVREKNDINKCSWLCLLTNRHDRILRFGDVSVKVGHGAVQVMTSQKGLQKSLVSCILV